MDEAEKTLPVRLFWIIQRSTWQPGRAAHKCERCFKLLADPFPQQKLAGFAAHGSPTNKWVWHTLAGIIVGEKEKINACRSDLTAQLSPRGCHRCLTNRSIKGYVKNTHCYPLLLKQAIFFSVPYWKRIFVEFICGIYKIWSEISILWDFFCTWGDSEFLFPSWWAPCRQRQWSAAVTCENRHAPVFQPGKEAPGITYAAFKPR